MKKRYLGLLLLPLLLIGCFALKSNKNSSSEPEVFDSQTIEHPRHTGEIGSFNLLSPENGFSTNKGFTFTWEEASNADYYQLELSSTLSFVTDDPDEVYVRESNISNNKFDLNYTLQTKDILYYWRVTAVNKDHTKKCNEIGNFFYESEKIDEIPITIEDEQDWVLHKEGSYADISIDRSNFFGNGQNSLAIVFDKEHTNQGIPKSDGWIVITKTEDRELYGTDSFYFNFYYSGHDATVLVRVLDYDGEYWHKQVQISNNSKQTVLIKYEDFELRTAGTNIFNRKFDWQHIRYFEIVFERTFGDGVCLFSNIKAVKYENYKDMFIQKMDFRLTDPKDWTYENYNFDKTISEDGNEITLGYTTGAGGFNGYGFQNINVYKYFVQGDAVRMKVKYTGTSSSAIFYFRILEEDNDRWQFKTPFSYFVKDEYKELVIPLKAFQRTDYMTGDGAKQFYFIQKFNVGLADNYSSGTISIKDLEVIKIHEDIEGVTKTRIVSDSGCIEDFENYNIYTEIYYQWEQSTVNKDEAMKLDTIHKTGGSSNKYCAEFDYKADMEQAVYQLYMDTSAAVGLNAFSIWLKDASVKYPDPAVEYLDEEDVTAEMTIQLTMDSGEWYRYTIDKVLKEWNKYTIAFSDFELFNESDLFDDPLPLQSDHIIHMAFGFKYLYYDQQGNHHPTYAIANPVYLDEIYFTNASSSSIEEIAGTIKPDTDDETRITIETMEDYTNTEEIFGWWSYGSALDYNEMALSNDVSVQGGNHSIRMHYQGATSVSYARATQFAKNVTAKGIALDIKGDGKATVYLNLNWRSGSNLFKMRYFYDTSKLPSGMTKVNRLKPAQDVWTHYEFGFTCFQDVGGTNKTLTSAYAREIESISFGIVNSDGTASDIYVDNIRFITTMSYTNNTMSVIS